LPFSDEKSRLYDPSAAYTVSTRNSETGRHFTVAMPFTPAESGSLRRIVIALTWVSGANEAIASRAIPLVAGTRYGVVAKANADTWGGWNWNSIHLSGPFARKFESGDWEMANDVLAAFSVLGD